VEIIVLLPEPGVVGALAIGCALLLALQCARQRVHVC
jgi:hypothetical protein